MFGVTAYVILCQQIKRKTNRLNMIHVSFEDIINIKITICTINIEKITNYSHE